MRFGESEGWRGMMNGTRVRLKGLEKTVLKAGN